MTARIIHDMYKLHTIQQQYFRDNLDKTAYCTIFSLANWATQQEHSLYVCD